MPLNAPLRVLCQRVLDDIKPAERRRLLRSATSAFGRWRERQVLTEPLGLRYGTIRGEHPFRSDTDLVLYFLRDGAIAPQNGPLGRLGLGAIAALLLDQLDEPTVLTDFYSELFTDELLKNSKDHTRDRVTNRLDALMAPMRKEFQSARKRRVKGGKAKKSIEPLKEFIKEKLGNNADFNPKRLKKMLSSHSSAVPFVYQGIHEFWIDGDDICYQIDGKKIRVLKPSTIAAYFTEIRKVVRNSE